MKENLGSDFKIIEEGACDRTGFADNDKGSLYSAQRHFPKMISKTENLDILILAVGTNDLQFKYDISFKQIENGLEKLIITAKNHAKRIIIIPPAILDNNVLKGNFNFQFDELSISKSKKVGKIYRKSSKVYGLNYFDLNEFVKPSEADGLNYDKIGHNIIAEKLAEFIKI